MSAIIERLNWRYATKAFDPSKKIEDEKWKVLEESMRLAPSSFGLQPWKFIVVKDEALRAKLQEHSWNQKQVTEASHYVVFSILNEVSDKEVDRFIASTAQVRSQEIDQLQGYADMMKSFTKSMGVEKQRSWNGRQSYIAMGFLMLAAAELGIDTCPMEGIDPSKYDELLGLTGSDYGTIAGVALGYRSADDKYAVAPKVRYSAAEVIEYK